MSSAEQPEFELEDDNIPELPVSDKAHLLRQYKLYGKGRVIQWLQSKVALPTRLELQELNGEDVNKKAYYQALADHFINTYSDSNESD